MKDAIVRMFSSRKFLICLVACLVATALAALGKLPVSEVATFVGTLVTTLTLAIAAEDAAEKFGAHRAPSQQNTVTVATIDTKKEEEP